MLPMVGAYHAHLGNTLRAELDPSLRCCYSISEPACHYERGSAAEYFLPVRQAAYRSRNIDSGMRLLRRKPLHCRAVISPQHPQAVHPGSVSRASCALCIEVRVSRLLTFMQTGLTAGTRYNFRSQIRSHAAGGFSGSKTSLLQQSIRQPALKLTHPGRQSGNASSQRSH
jgi:hypothetical protein